MAMHWGDEFLATGVNALTAKATCPDSRQPELKFSAVSVRSASLPWRLSACAWVPAADAAALRGAAQPAAGLCVCRMPCPVRQRLVRPEL